MAENLPHHTPGATGMAAVDWDGELPARLRAAFPDVVFRSYLEQHWVECASSVLASLILHLRDAEQFDMLIDLTAVDWPKNPERFEVVYILYSFANNEYVRVKTRIPENEQVRSITSVFAGANWLEREVFDMFGLRFSGHPNLKRILLPEDWQGYPLLKDKSIIDMDQDWVHRNLGIESGQS